MSVMKTRKPRQLLPALGNAELGRLLHFGDGVGADRGQADDVGTGTLGLQQERGEIAGVERMAHAADDLAAGRLG